MTETKHTAGPWEAVEVGQGGPADAPMPVYEIHAGGGRAIVAEFVDGWNAPLISAAPELLEALKLARDYVHEHLVNRKAALAGWPDKWRVEEADLATVDAAIAKALGEPPHV